eukprot:TRINITY_DN20760_c0_g1_i2.p3 TRINITY_DN20760_c0_g1~~TRINITY_DN20760_c0_g1_i2.p3  ORF type:complete len:105 (+),score=37.63 TRINITY_DN20760_c0_g1_i2:83-397(+)
MGSMCGKIEVPADDTSARPGGISARNNWDDEIYGDAEFASNVTTAESDDDIANLNDVLSDGGASPRVRRVRFREAGAVPLIAAPRTAPPPPPPSMLLRLRGPRR